MFQIFNEVLNDDFQIYDELVNPVFQITCSNKVKHFRISEASVYRVGIEEFAEKS